jgi:hypothetical protein
MNCHSWLELIFVGHARRDYRIVQCRCTHTWTRVRRCAEHHVLRCQFLGSAISLVPVFLNLRTSTSGPIDAATAILKLPYLYAAGVIIGTIADIVPYNAQQQRSTLLRLAQCRGINSIHRFSTEQFLALLSSSPVDLLFMDYSISLPRTPNSVNLHTCETLSPVIPAS